MENYLSEREGFGEHSPVVIFTQEFNFKTYNITNLESICKLMIGYAQKHMDFVTDILVKLLVSLGSILLHSVIHRPHITI